MLRPCTTVRVDAGVTVYQLLEYLRSVSLTLPTFPWWIDQTVGGAVAGAHTRPHLNST